VRVLIAKGALIDSRAPGLDNCTALHVSALNGFVECLEALLVSGADGTAQSGNGSTALHYAAKFGHSGAVRLLCDRGVDVNARDGNGCTALHLAVAEGQTPAVAALLAAHADVTAQASNGWTPLHVAASLRDTVSLEALLACPDTEVMLYTTAPAPAGSVTSVLEVAVREGRRACATLLVEVGACLGPGASQETKESLAAMVTASAVTAEADCLLRHLGDRAGFVPASPGGGGGPASGSSLTHQHQHQHHQIGVRNWAEGFIGHTEALARVVRIVNAMRHRASRGPALRPPEVLCFRGRGTLSSKTNLSRRLAVALDKPFVAIDASLQGAPLDSPFAAGADRSGPLPIHKGLTISDALQYHAPRGGCVIMISGLEHPSAPLDAVLQALEGRRFKDLLGREADPRGSVFVLVTPPAAGSELPRILEPCVGSHVDFGESTPADFHQLAFTQLSELRSLVRRDRGALLLWGPAVQAMVASSTQDLQEVRRAVELIEGPLHGVAPRGSGASAGKGSPLRSHHRIIWVDYGVSGYSAERIHVGAGAAGSIATPSAASAATPMTTPSKPAAQVFPSLIPERPTTSRAAQPLPPTPDVARELAPPPQLHALRLLEERLVVLEQSLPAMISARATAAAVDAVEVAVKDFERLRPPPIARSPSPAPPAGVSDWAGTAGTVETQGRILARLEGEVGRLRSALTQLQEDHLIMRNDVDEVPARLSSVVIQHVAAATAATVPPPQASPPPRESLDRHAIAAAVADALEDARIDDRRLLADLKAAVDAQSSGVIEAMGASSEVERRLRADLEDRLREADRKIEQIRGELQKSPEKKQAPAPAVSVDAIRALEARVAHAEALCGDATDRAGRAAADAAEAKSQVTLNLRAAKELAGEVAREVSAKAAAEFSAAPSTQPSPKKAAETAQRLAKEVSEGIAREVAAEVARDTAKEESRATLAEVDERLKKHLQQQQAQAAASSPSKSKEKEKEKEKEGGKEVAALQRVAADLEARVNAIDHRGAASDSALRKALSDVEAAMEALQTRTREAEAAAAREAKEAKKRFAEMQALLETSSSSHSPGLSAKDVEGMITKALEKQKAQPASPAPAPTPTPTPTPAATKGKKGASASPAPATPVAPAAKPAAATAPSSPSPLVVVKDLAASPEGRLRLAVVLLALCVFVLSVLRPPVLGIPEVLAGVIAAGSLVLAVPSATYFGLGLAVIAALAATLLKE
jgi:hypothetical protein